MVEEIVSITYKLSEIEQTAQQLLNKYADRKVWCFYGPVGAGKTTFIKSICKSLKVIDETQSPTFAIINKYLTAEKEGEAIYHMDLYRLELIDEALDIGVEDILDSGSYCFIEWPELIAPILPEETVQLTFSIEGLDSRKILLS